MGYEKFLVDPSKKVSRVTVSGDEARADVQFLVEALEKAYPAQWVMNQTQWVQIIQNLNSLGFDDTIDVDKFGDSIADILWSIPDGHLIVRSKGQARGTFYKKYQRHPATGTNLANLEAGEYWKLELRQTSAGKVAILAISGFPQSSDPSWNGFGDAIEVILKAQSLIVDLRGNAGGDDTKAIELVSSLLGYQLDMSWVRQIFCESPEACALQINSYERIVWNNFKNKGEATPKELINHIQELKEKALGLSINPPLNKKLVVEDKESILTDGFVSPKFNSNIFILVDPYTVSSGEWTSLYFKKHPKTKIVGQNTYGMIHFGNTGYLQLPNSGLSLLLCSKINEIVDGQFYEKSGVPPDIQVSGEDSLEYVLQHCLGYQG